MGAVDEIKKLASNTRLNKIREQAAELQRRAEKQSGGMPMPKPEYKGYDISKRLAPIIRPTRLKSRLG